jgi:putative hydrolase of the HAD superfamily
VISRLIVWDLDDTIMDNVHDYSQPILDTLSVIVRELGRKAPHVTELMRIEHEIDKNRIQEINPETGEKFLFSMERFPGSQVETYRYLCREVRVKPDAAVEQELWNIGMRAFDPERYIKNIRPEAKAVVEQLHVIGTRQVLMTKGDDRVQEKKLVALRKAGLYRKFDWVRVVPTKDAEDFKEVMRNVSVSLSYISIGNSFGSDIKPALDAGYTGILVPTWSWEEIHQKDELYALAEEDDRVFIAETLADVPAIVEAL